VNFLFPSPTLLCYTIDTLPNKMPEEKSKKASKSLSTKQRTIIVVVVLGLIFFFILSFLGLCGICAFLTPATEESSESQKLEEEIAGVVTELPSEVGVEKTYKVTDVIDGDTIKIEYEGVVGSVRLIGIDTPENKECFNQEATNKMESFVKGKEVTIEFDQSQGERDKYGRLLLYIWQGSAFINDRMIRDGYAHEYTYDKPYKYMDQFKEAEKEARENNRGLWGNVCTCQEGEEKERTCIACHTAQFTRTHWDCSTFTEDVTDNSCTSGCYTPPAPTTTTTPAPAPSPGPSYVCDCSKTCPEMSSCEEAYYQLNTCGCSQRDGDNDGVPCESICPGG